MKHTKKLMLFLLAIVASGCSTLAGSEDMGVVIARRAQVRSSTAVVAADLKEVVRGDVLDIIDTTETEGEQWLRVRTRDAESTEGWIESRNVMPQEMLERSRQLAKEDEEHTRAGVWSTPRQHQHSPLTRPKRQRQHLDET